ncbi:glycosyltransferase, partial [Candidatus Bathyarchaeota archaeon]
SLEGNGKDHVEIRNSFLEDRDVEGLFAKSNVVVAPYKGSVFGSSGVISRAMAHQKPVVYSPVPIFVEELRDLSTNGFAICVDPADSKRLAESATALWKKDIDRAKYERRTALRSWNETADKTRTGPGNSLLGLVCPAPRCRVSWGRRAHTQLLLRTSVSTAHRWLLSGWSVGSSSLLRLGLSLRLSPSLHVHCRYCTIPNSSRIQARRIPSLPTHLFSRFFPGSQGLRGRTCCPCWSLLLPISLSHHNSVDLKRHPTIPTHILVRPSSLWATLAG